MHHQVPSHRTLILVRHATTAWTLLGRHTGTTDLPLTPEGEEQARRLTPILANLQPEAIFTSPLARAKRTCELSGWLQPATLSNLLVEWDYGEYEGLTSQEIQKKNPEWDLFTSGAPGGESCAQITKRIALFADEVRSVPGNGAVMIFAHGHILRAFATHWLGLPLSMGRILKLSPPSVSILGDEHGRAAIVSWNIWLAN